MTPTVVTVGGTETDNQTGPPREPRSRGLVLLVVGLGAGLVLGALFTGTTPDEAGPTSTAVSEPDASPTTTVRLTTTTTDSAPTRLATMAPGMLDVLVTSAVDRNGMSVVTSWQPAGRGPTVEPLPWGDLIADASKTWLAFGGPNRWVAGRTLWVGNPAYMEPVTSQLLFGPVWHTRHPGTLAWVEGTFEGGTLMTTELVAGQLATPRAVTAVDASANLVGWNDVGFLTARFGPGSGTLELRGADGEVIETIEIAQGPITVGRDFVIVVDPDGDQILLDQTLTPVAAAPWGNDCQRAAWGPNGVTVALLCGFGTDQRFEYWPDPLTQSEPHFTHSGEEYTDFGFASNGLPFVAWIESLRPASTILFYHPANGGEYEISYPGLAQWLESLQS